jgi:hypothetical protein
MHRESIFQEELQGQGEAPKHETFQGVRGRGLREESLQPEDDVSNLPVNMFRSTDHKWLSYSLLCPLMRWKIPLSLSHLARYPCLGGHLRGTYYRASRLLLAFA